jgi:hypothetical protein
MRRAWFACALAACGSGGGDDSGPDAAPPGHAGGVALSSLKSTSPALASTAASAAFTDSACTQSARTGGCYIQTCTPSQTYVSGGTVTISGGSETITLMPRADNMYQTFSAMTEVFQPGQMASVSTTGGTAPAYMATLTMPSRITITAPAKSTTAVGVDRTQDYTITWSGGTSGDVELFASSTTNPNSYVICAIPASAGSGTILSALLSMLPAGMGSISFIGWSTTQKISGDWSLYFSLFEDALWPDGSIASLPVTFQ